MTTTSDGSTASYYELPEWAQELADLIRYKNLNGSQAEMFRALYRGSEASHSDEQRQAKKLLAYAVDEMVRTHFPGESFAPYRSATFRIFDKPPTSSTPLVYDVPNTQLSSHPRLTCESCRHCKHTLGDDACFHESVKQPHLADSWSLCLGTLWESASKLST